MGGQDGPRLREERQREGGLAVAEVHPADAIQREGVQHRVVPRRGILHMQRHQAPEVRQGLGAPSLLDINIELLAIHAAGYPDNIDLPGVLTNIGEILWRHGESATFAARPTGSRRALRRECRDQASELVGVNSVLPLNF